MKVLRSIAAALALVLALSAQAQEEQAGELSIAAIRLGVTNLDASIDFYTKHLGCTMSGDHRKHNYVMLENNGVYLVLTHADAAISIGDEMCHTRINFEVKDLDASIASMKAGGVRFLHGEKQSAVGRYATFLDPSGNQHNIKQLNQQQAQAITSPRIYDVGISVLDMAKAADFYVKTLGFEEATRQYYPPVVPMKQRGSTFFILSEGSRFPAPYDYGKKALTGLAFYVEDLNATITALRERGVRFIHDQPRKAGNVIFAAFKDPFGNVHEVMSYDDSPPQVDDQPDADAVATSAKHEVSELRWLAGTWETTVGGSRLREVWSSPIGETGAMMGMFQWPRNGKSWMYEFMTLEQEDDRVVFRLRHFDPNLKPWEADGPQVYPLTELGKGKAIFTNPQMSGDHPRQIIYNRQEDTLTVSLVSGNEQDKPFEFTFKLVRD